MYWDQKKPFTVLVGKTLTRIEGAERGSEQIDFFATDGSQYRMCHISDCCESVDVDDVIGDLSDLLNTPTLSAEESTSGTNPEGVTKQYQDSFTWTFYRIVTVKGTVVIRWYGESNGYYSERVDFLQMEAPESADAVARTS